MGTASDKWVRGFNRRQALGTASEKDYRKMAEHIETAKAKIRDSWAEEEEQCRRRNISRDEIRPYELPTIRVSEIIGEPK